MRKLGWFAVSATVAALIAFGVVLLAANLYVQSQVAQQRIRQTLTDALHVPISLKKTTLTPWEGLRLDGIILHAPSPAAAASTEPGDFMTVDSFRVRVALWPLLRERRVVIESILLDHPRLAWAQNPDGRWSWPEAPEPKRRHEARVAVSGLVPDAAEPLSANSGGPVLPAPSTFVLEPAKLVPVPDHVAAVTPAPLTAVPRFRVRHGSLDLLNGHRQPLGSLEEVDLEGQLRPDGHAAGDLRCARASLAQPSLSLTNFRSGFTFDQHEGLSIDGGTGELAGGKLAMDYKLLTQEPGSPFSAECQVRDVDLAELLREAGSRLRLMEGRLQGGVQLEGSSDDPGRRHATGQLRLIGAQIRHFPILEMLGEMLRIKDLSHPQFKTAELDCQLDGEDLQIAPLRLVSNDLQVLARGHYATDKDQMDLHGRLTIDPAISRQLPQFIEMNFSPCENEDAGRRYIDFDVTGPLAKPSTNLFDRVLAGPSSDLLQNLLAPKPKKPRKTPKPAGQTPVPTPTAGGTP